MPIFLHSKIQLPSAQELVNYPRKKLDRSTFEKSKTRHPDKSELCQPFHYLNTKTCPIKKINSAKCRILDKGI